MVFAFTRGATCRVRKRRVRNRFVLLALLAVALVVVSHINGLSAYLLHDYKPNLSKVLVGQAQGSRSRQSDTGTMVLRGSNVPRQYNIEGFTLAPTPEIPDTQAPTTFRTPKSERCVGSVFRQSIDVWLDDECYPPLVTYNDDSIVFGRDSAGRIVLEPMKTQNWAYDVNYAHMDHIRGTPAKLKMFENTLVYRIENETTTYFRNGQIWGASQKCLSRTTPARAWDGDVINLEVIEEAVLLSSQAFAYGYYHIVQDHMLPIGLARDLLSQNKDMKIIMEDKKHLVMEFYDLLGMDSSSRVIINSNGRALRVKKLYLPYYALCGIIHPGLIKSTVKWIRDSQPSLYAIRSTLARDIVVIDRRKGDECPRRCLTNTDELISTLKADFPDRNLVHLKATVTYSLVEQMEMFSNAELIVAPHGAGLTNMIFSPPHAKIIEIFNNHMHFNPCYVDLAIDLGLKYRLVAPLKTSNSTVNFYIADIQRTMEAVHLIMKSNEDSPSGN